MRVVISSGRLGLVGETLRGPVAEYFLGQGSEVRVLGFGEVPASLCSCDLLITDSANEVLRFRNSRDIHVRTVILADPKFEGPKAVEAVRLADYCLVGSRELAASVSALGGRPLVFYWVPADRELEAHRITNSVRSLDGSLRIVYQGNKAHLEGMRAHVLPALDSLASEYDFVLELDYNLGGLGTWKPGRSREFEIKHHQWDHRRTWRRVAQADIGIVPNLIPVRNFALPIRYSKFLRRLIPDPHGRREDDHLLRFKTHSNPGRLFPFAYYSVPVIADFYPSSAEFITDGINGRLAYSFQTWRDALEALLVSSSARKRMGQEFHKTVSTRLALLSSLTRIQEEIS